MMKKREIETVLPAHIAVIMDGNGRWAKKRGLPRMAGHTAGARTFKNIARYCNKIGIRYMTTYAFSTENWKRPQEEVNSIMNLLREYLRDAKNFKEDNIKVKFIGDLSKLDADIVQLIKEAEDGSIDATGMNLNIALNYGGRDEIVNAAKNLAKKVKVKELDIDEITAETFESELYTAGQPDPDIVIRPSGEMRLSNYLLWQSAYSEFMFFDILWPNFKPKHIDMAVEQFNKRERRYGGV